MAEDQIQVPEGWNECELAEVIIEKPKSTIKVSKAANFGEYPFFTSGESILLHDKNIIVGENLFLATGGVANIKYFNGAAAYSTDTFVVSTNEKAKADYLYYYLLSKVDFINKNYFEGSGLKHLQKKDFRKHIFSLPTSTKEQQKITSILSKLDGAIVQTEQLIEKYKQIKVGLMHDLLTRGIDKKGNIRSEETHKFKNSPLGRIPVEWNVVKFEDVCNMVLGKMLDKSKNIGINQPYLRNVNVRWGGFDFSDITEMPFLNGEAERYGLKKNDLIICEGGEPGRCAVWNEDLQNMKFQKALHRVRCKVDVDVYFLYYVMFWFALNNRLEDFFSGTTIKHLTGEALKTIPVFKPSIDEQKIIVDKLKKAETLITKEQKTLNKLCLQKSGLIHDLLTGKVRVGSFEEQEELVSNTDTIQRKTKAHNQHIEDAVLITAIINAFYSDKYPLGRKKVQKLLYLVRRHQEANMACFKKKAAGPYADEVRYKGGEPIAKANKYIATKTSTAGTVFSKGENIAKALAYIEKWEMQSDIDWLIAQFKYTKVDQLELIATIDMARCDLEKENTPVSLSTVKHLIATNEEWKKKLEKSYFDDFSIQRGIDESYKLFGY